MNDVPAGGSLRMLHTQVDPNCEPMDFYLPSARRNTVVISADGATFEYFEVPVRLIEILQPVDAEKEERNGRLVFMKSPQGDEIKEVEATAATLTPLMVAGWHQVPAPAAASQKPAAPAEEEK